MPGGRGCRYGCGDAGVVYLVSLLFLSCLRGARRLRLVGSSGEIVSLIAKPRKEGEKEGSSEARIWTRVQRLITVEASNLMADCDDR